LSSAQFRFHMLVNSSSEVLYYGRIKQNSESGTADITIPSGLGIGEYTLKVFNEQYHGDYKTDYASDFKDITLTVSKAEQTAPQAPELENRTQNSITLKEITNNNGIAARYSMNGGDWQDSPVFTGLSAGTEYSFKARYKGTDNYAASPASSEAKFSTRSSTIAVYYTLTFEIGEGNKISLVRVRYNSSVDLSAYEPTRSGYTFDGWYSDIDLTERITRVTLTKNMTVYAGWHEEKNELSDADKVNALIKEIRLKATTSKTSKKNVKVKVSEADKTDSLIKEIEAMGYTVKYRFCRAAKASDSYIGKKTKDTASWINTKGKKGTKYYYKAKVYVYDRDTLVGKTALKQCSYSSRIWSK